MKCCSNCRSTKSSAEFENDKSKRDGLASWCRTCKNTARRNRYHDNLDHERQRSRDYYAANRETRMVNYDAAAQRERYIAWKAQNPDGLWAQWLKKAHGMLPEEWQAMWDQQAGRCYLCDQALPDNRSKVMVDHDHSHCGKKRSCRYCRRGLAHEHCNLILGMLGEDPAAMRHVLAASFVANFERTQAQTQALLTTAPMQGSLF